MSFRVETGFIFEREFKRLYKKYPSLKSDLASLIQELKKDPFIGIPIGMDCYKIRMAITSKNRGKSGGSRIITHVKVIISTVYLVSIYDKAEQEDIEDNDLKERLTGL
jgi:mRNA-degrading endonuclease RelE of RelBE toxin-antitoxin system